ncbi:conserved Plasmodium protein, unknown function [Plasmodium berghei]|uniref:Uncharacterized protein n=2 Tax=Plasmodium berghei TaxID=5821 RepID=A0A509AN89_PLABA|nr:conserved Plasmodium protein, unknown function [Plasmodium berghei ANKA]CXI55054.1 conserved Plasmodium protein, unknown function [Plasmodium berghei]SCL95093.1 conserved Plasmodium protein, unknown function [Plasmodium berghei]SCM17967.1 conserved Plasmodium protein, unknown function [Plasmodium berghei]VUC56293.1 conserved Plasmodium protein, unknown function [Plasmodium berghei ANKA]|eukprot:XP_034422095.1 conserved Plasmodium protein, unknown function [Plasmodium berghei ANKA]
MAPKVVKKKKNKLKVYDLDESKNIFLYVYEHQLKNEKINWKKAEELKITRHSGSSMRGHYVNSIKNEISLYLEMYAEEVAKVFNKVKKWKKDEKKKILLFQNNFVKQKSNISLDRLTKRKSTNYNKFNSLIISKAFSMVSIKKNMISNKKYNFLTRNNKAETKKKKTAISVNTTNKSNDINKISIKKNKIKQMKIVNPQKKKNIKKKKKKNVIIKNALEKPNKNLNTKFRDEINGKRNSNCIKEDNGDSNNWDHKNKKQKLKDQKVINEKIEKMYSLESINNEIDQLNIINKSIKNNCDLEETIKLEKNSPRKSNENNSPYHGKIKNKKFPHKYNSKEYNKVNMSFKRISSNNNTNKRKGNSISSVFSYLYKKVFY